jgi:hypothetical protein
MDGSAAKDGVSYPLQQRVINPIVMLAWELGFRLPATPCWRRLGGVRDSRGARQCAMAWTGRPSGWWPSAGGAPTG